MLIMTIGLWHNRSSRGSRARANQREKKARFRQDTQFSNVTNVKPDPFPSHLFVS